MMVYLLNIRTPDNLAVNILKLKTKRFYSGLIPFKDADGIETVKPLLSLHL